MSVISYDFKERSESKQKICPSQVLHQYKLLEIKALGWIKVIHKQKWDLSEICMSSTWGNKTLSTYSTEPDEISHKHHQQCCFSLSLWSALIASLERRVPLSGFALAVSVVSLGIWCPLYKSKFQITIPKLIHPSLVQLRSITRVKARLSANRLETPE